MGIKDPRVDAYIGSAAPFAAPILGHIRDVVHDACPGVRETIKWGMPHFEHEGLLCSMAAFKQHCALNFWKGALLKESVGTGSTDAMGQFGRITALSDLPARSKLATLVKKAAALNESGVKRPVTTKAPSARLSVPAYFRAALAKNKQAQAAFEAFSPSHKREYVEWVIGAKTEETRQKRLVTAIEWMAEGKPQNWRYLRKAEEHERAGATQRARQEPAAVRRRHS